METFNWTFCFLLVFRGRVLGKLYRGEETRYDVQVIHTYRNSFRLEHREFLWAPNVCDCPHLEQGRQYILMVRRHINYERTLNRILLEEDSYVVPYRPREDELLRPLESLCSNRGPKRPAEPRGWAWRQTVSVSVRFIHAQCLISGPSKRHQTVGWIPEWRHWRKMTVGSSTDSFSLFWNTKKTNLKAGPANCTIESTLGGCLCPPLNTYQREEHWLKWPFCYCCFPTAIIQFYMLYFRVCEKEQSTSERLRKSHQTAFWPTLCQIIWCYSSSRYLQQLRRFYIAANVSVI